MNVWIFDTFVDWILLPAPRSDDILVMDNLSSHKTYRLQRSVGSISAALLNDLNPIEKIFSKMKASLRRSAARTAKALDKAISKAIASMTSDHCFICFRA